MNDKIKKSDPCSSCGHDILAGQWSLYRTLQAFNVLFNVPLILILIFFPRYYEIILFAWSEYLNGGDFLIEKYNLNKGDIFLYISTIPAIGIHAYLHYRILREREISKKVKMLEKGLLLSFIIAMFAMAALPQGAPVRDMYTQQRF